MSFFALEVKPGLELTNELPAPLRLRMASLPAELATDKSERTTLVISVDNKTFVSVCSLTPGLIEQQVLDVKLDAQTELSLRVVGPNPITVMGTFAYDDEMFSGEDSDDSDEDDHACCEHDEDDEDEEDEDDEKDEDEEEDDEDDKEDSDEEEEVPVVTPEPKSRNALKKEKKRAEQAAALAAKVPKALAPSEATNGKNAREEPKKRKQEEVEAATTAAAVSKKSKGEKAAATPSTTPETFPTVTLQGGLKVTDLTKANPEAQRAKAGQRIEMRYIGRLTNGKIFDSNTKGQPFAFRLGRSEVIAGWDQGIVGMAVGQRRKLVIPPKLAYGHRGAPPDIPGNATLEFEVKLLAIR